MFVNEDDYNKFIHYLHLLSDNRATCVLEFRMVRGSLTPATLKQAKSWLYRLQIMERHPNPRTFNKEVSKNGHA